MKKKIIFNTVLVAGLLLYVISFIATSKPHPQDPCLATATFWFQKDSIRSRFHQLYQFNDTILISADTLQPPMDWNTVCDTICKIYNDSCKRTGTPILVINQRDTSRSTWDNRFGKKILFRKCP
jgi:hypothetical protein